MSIMIFLATLLLFSAAWIPSEELLWLKGTELTKIVATATWLNTTAIIFVLQKTFLNTP